MIFSKKKYRISFILVILTVLSLAQIFVPQKSLCNDQKGLQYRLFLDELYLFQDQFSLTIKDTLKAQIPWAKIETILEKKKTSYNLSFASLLKKYNICPNDLYDSLDSLWKNAISKGKKICKRLEWGTGPVGNITNLALHECWDDYLENTKQFAIQIAESKLIN